MSLLWRTFYVCTELFISSYEVLFGLLSQLRVRATVFYHPSSLVKAQHSMHLFELHSHFQVKLQCTVMHYVIAFVYVLLHDCVNARVCNLHSLHHTGHFGSYKLHTVYLRSVDLLLSHSVLVEFFRWQTQAGLKQQQN